MKKKNRKKIDRKFNAFDHFNRFINENVIYNKNEHEICCHNCDECDHFFKKCSNDEIQKLISTIRRRLQQITA